MLYDYVEAIMKHWWPLLIGIFGSFPWWGRALLSTAFQEKIDAYFNPNATRVLAIVVIASAFIYANYKAWLIENERAIYLDNELKKEMAEKEPNLTATEFGFFSSTNVTIRGRIGCMAVFYATISNLGAPTTAGYFNVSISRDGKDITAAPLVMPERLNLQHGGEQAFTYTNADHLSRKCSELIISGRPTYGIIPMFFEGLSKTDLMKENWTIIFKFKDASSKNYVFKIKNNVSGDSLGPLRMNEMQELP